MSQPATMRPAVPGDLAAAHAKGAVFYRRDHSGIDNIDFPITDLQSLQQMISGHKVNVHVLQDVTIATYRPAKIFAADVSPSVDHGSGTWTRLGQAGNVSRSCTEPPGATVAPREREGHSDSECMVILLEGGSVTSS